jgi:hypothetical protein
MRRTVRSDRVDFVLGPYRDLDGVDLDDLRAAAERYGRFLGLEASLH